MRSHSRSKVWYGDAPKATTKIEHGDIIDVRAVIARYEAIEGSSEEEEIEERSELDNLLSNLKGNPLTLIADDYFETYAQELAEDIGAIGRDASWPLSYIDWTAAADALKLDYFVVEFAGQDYWTR